MNNSSTKQWLLPGLMLLFAAPVAAQNPAAGKPQERPVALVGGTLHPVSSPAIEKGVIVFDKGIITAVGDAATPYDTAATEVLNITGKHVFPGSIAMAGTVGLQEIASVRATLDFEEVGDFNPHARALVAYNTDSEVIPTLRSSGLLLVQATPQGGLISGTSSLFHTDGWNWEDAVLRQDDGIWLNWPPYITSSFNIQDFSSSLRKNEKRQEIIESLHRFFAEAKAYHETPAPATVNLRFEAMKGLFQGTQNLYIRARYAKDIIEATKFSREAGIAKVVIAGANEAGKVVTFLKENNIPVVLDQLHRLPDHQDAYVYQPYELPGILLNGGVKVALSYSSEWWRARNLNYQAGTAAGFSDLSHEEALKLVTLYPAQILGVDGQVGSLEKGKHATLVVTGGDMLDMKSNSVEAAFIRGSAVDLDDKHKRLYRKYKEKYGQP